MTQSLFGTDFRAKILRAMVGRRQGWDAATMEGLSTKELLDEVRRKDPELSKRLIADMFRETYDLQREASITRANVLDGIYANSDASIPGEQTFETFHIPDQHTQGLTDAFAAAKGWSMGLSPNLLTLAGPPGVGKTHLALAAARARLRPPHRPVLFRTEKAILDELHHGMRDAAQGPPEVMKVYAEGSWLVIDDLGAGATSEWDKAQIDDLINQRWIGAAQGLHTLITTNLTGQSMPPRIASRLGDVHVARTVVVRASDYRQGG